MTRRPPMPLVARIAEKVMGWSKMPPRNDPGFTKGVYYDIYCDPDGWHVNRPQSAVPWNPLANPADLMDVIGELRKRNLETSISVEPGLIYVEISDHRGDLMAYGNLTPRGANTWQLCLARAVCRAALEAVR